MHLKDLSDSELRAKTQSIVRQECELMLQVLHQLLEVDRRKVFVDFGYLTLFLYVRKELGYSEAEAQLRIEAMRMLRDLIRNEVGSIETALSTGKLTITHLAQVKRALRRDRLPVEKSEELLTQITGLSTRESEKVIAQACHQNAPRRKLILDLTDDQYELWMQVRAELLHHGNRAELIFQKLCEQVLKEVSKQTPSVNSRLRPINLNRRTVSVAHRKQFLKKHCEHPGCESRLGLQIDHKTEWSRGGKTNHENLQVLCVNHHARKSYLGK